MLIRPSSNSKRNTVTVAFLARKWETGRYLKITAVRGHIRYDISITSRVALGMVKRGVITPNDFRTHASYMLGSTTRKAVNVFV